MFVLILPQAEPVGWSNPLKNPLRPLSEVAYSVQAFDWSGQVRPESGQVVVCLLLCMQQLTLDRLEAFSVDKSCVASRVELAMQ